MSSSFIDINLHIVFSTKGRITHIDSAWIRDLHAYLGGCVRASGNQTFAVGGVGDHVHLLLGIRSTQSVSDLIRDIKRASSVWAAEKNPGFAWQIGYGAFSVSHEQKAAVTAYIGRQAEHHKHIDSKEEMRALLAECGIVPDERYFE